MHIDVTYVDASLMRMHHMDASSCGCITWMHMRMHHMDASHDIVTYVDA